jgi:MFS family permease
VPQAYRRNFLHLYFDIGWFGVLSGSAVAFLSIYLVRIGATEFQVGLVSAIPAVVSVLAALPSGWWLRDRPVDDAVFWSSVLFRVFYLAWVPLPLLLGPRLQTWAFLVTILVMSVPGTVLAVSFNALFAAVVPPEWRGHVAGVRNAVLALTSVLTSLLCGALLVWLPFPLGYQVVFGVGFLGAAMSCLHLRFLRARPAAAPLNGRAPSLGDTARPGRLRALGDAMSPGVGLRFLLQPSAWRLPGTRVLRGSFGPVLAALFAFHLTQYLAIPLFPIYWVEALSLTDQQISLGNALFYGFVFLGSTQLGRLSARWGHHRVLVTGTLLMAGYPFLTALTREVGLFLFASVYGGIAWSLVGGALANYILDLVPDDDRPAHLAWYNVALNLAILMGSLLGPLAGRVVGLVPALVVIAILRLLGGLSLWRLGRARV